MDNAEKILAEARRTGEVRRALHRLVSMSMDRATVMGSKEQGEVSHKTSSCLLCGGGLKKKNTGVDSVFVCMTCGWTKVFHGQVFDETREMGEAYLPGVTGVLRGMRMMTVKNGKVVGVEGGRR